GLAKPQGSAAYVLVPERLKQVTLARMLDDGAHRTVVVRDARRAEEVRAFLRARGYITGEAGSDVEVASYAGTTASGATLAYDVPPYADTFQRLDLANVR